MPTTYLIGPPDAHDRMPVTSYPTRESAVAAATVNDRIIGGPDDILWTGRLLVDVYNSVSDGRPLRKFETLSYGRERLMAAIASVAVEGTPPQQQEIPMPTPEQQPQASGGDATTEQRRRGRARVFADSAARRGTVVELTPTKKINKLVTENPKRPGTTAFDRFTPYISGMTVEQALAAGVKRGDIRWDVAHGYIELVE